MYCVKEGHLRAASNLSINGLKARQAMRNLSLANGHVTHCMSEDILVEVIQETSAKTFEYG